MIFDSHAHYDDEAFEEDRETLLSSFQDNGIGYVTNIGANMETSLNSVRLAEKYDFIYAAVGIHPESPEENTEENMKKLSEYCRHKKVVAIGEIGLDYHYEPLDKKAQRACFEAQLEVAVEKNMPVVIHSRDAAKDTLDIVKNYYGKLDGGVIHCFSYGPEIAKEYLDMGFYIGIGGVLTFKNAKKLKEVAEHVPIERIVIETDCPYLSPEPNRGKRNSSLNLPYVVTALSEIKGISAEAVVDITCKNALEMYRIDDAQSARNGE